MSTSYEIDGVTITPQPGGFYELTHPSFPEPLRERGKEKADARAREAAAALKIDDEGHMPPQGPLPTDPPEVPGTVTASAPPAPETMTPPETVAEPQGDSDEVAALKARIAELEQAGVRTVVTEGPASSGPDIKAQKLAPQQYTGPLDPEVKAKLEELGIKTTRIVLEENETIPPTGLFVQHNGRPYMIKPGEPVDVPDFLIGILNDAVTSAPIVDDKSLKVLGYRDRMKYPYRRVD